ncbi:MAG: hypothetical protein KAT83_00155 [Candidatus Aenigmarchaeota archaeon]|nr:hypothetical protein [Candidatus Aenigmarchaeota archaeon]
MESKSFSSPREEALEIAQQTTRNILNSKKDVVSILRACMVISTRLNKKEDEKWIRSDLSGYLSNEIPEYRKIYCAYQNRQTKEVLVDLIKTEIDFPIHLICSKIQKNEELRLSCRDGKIAVSDTTKLESITSAVIDRCFFFLNDIVTELQYGGAVEYFMEEIRKNVDEKLAKLDKNLSNETSSLYINLSSTNPADWTKVGHSCRSVLKSLADYVFPPQKKNYKTKDNNEIKVGDPQFINRLLAFVEQKLSGDKRKLLQTEIQYIEPYLSQVVEFANMGEHNKKLEKFDAHLIAVHTYLIISQILKLVPDVDETVTKKE